MSDSAELGFMTAEYEAQHARAQASIAAASQHVSLFVGGVTLVATAVAGAAALLWATQQRVALGIVAGGLLFTSIGGTLTLFATYRARLQQTNSEINLCRIRHYFLAQWPHLTLYVAGSIHDDWQTPYSHPWRSNTVLAWIALIGFSSVAFGVSLAMVTLALFGTISESLFLVVALTGMLTAFVALFAWLWSRLRKRKQSYRARFPKTEVETVNQPAA